MEIDIVELTFEFESGGTHVVHLDKQLLISSFPDSFFASLFSERWKHQTKIMVPSTIVSKTIDSLKFRKNIVALLLCDFRNIFCWIKYYPFVDYYLSSNQQIFDEILIGRIKKEFDFKDFKKTILILNWLYDLGRFDIIKETCIFWTHFLKDFLPSFENLEFIKKYLLFCAVSQLEWKQTNIICPFDSITHYAEYHKSPFPVLVHNDTQQHYGKVFVSTLSQFEINLWEMCPFLNILPWQKGICIAGGSIISCLTNNHYTTRDVDIFVYPLYPLCETKDSMPYDEWKNHCFSQFNEILNLISNWAKQNGYDCFFVNEKSVITIIMKGLQYSYQLIPMNKINPDDIIKDFDADINQCYYDGSTVRCTAICLFSLSTSTIHRLRSGYGYRIHRLLQKGFSISSCIPYGHYADLLVFKTCERIEEFFSLSKLMSFLYHKDTNQQKIDKYWIPQGTESNEYILKKLNDHYPHATKVSTLTNDLFKSSEHFEMMRHPNYQQPEPKYVDIFQTDGIWLKKAYPRKHVDFLPNLFFINDLKGNDIMFVIHNVQVVEKCNLYFLKIDEKLAQKIKEIEKMVHQEKSSQYDLKSNVSNDNVFCCRKKRYLTTAFGTRTDTSKANIQVWLNLTFDNHSIMNEIDMTFIRFIALKIVWI